MTMLHPLVAAPSPNLAPLPAKKDALLIYSSDARRGFTKTPLHLRREFMYGLVGAGLASSVAAESANAARRPPPPSPSLEEKKDPSITGLRAKVLASIKRKEAMKEEIDRLRQKGKPVNS